MKQHILKSYSKINIHLGVVGRISPKLHKIESFVSLTSLHDIIKISQIKNLHHSVEFHGKFGKNIPTSNTITQLLKFIDKGNFLKGKKFKINIKKNIPLSSGMGGGSMNAASLITYFLKKKLIYLNHKQINRLCSNIGSDVVLGLNNKSKIINNKGHIINLKKKFNVYIVIIKPNFGCKTGEIYGKVRQFSNPVLIKNKINNLDDLLNLKNDLEIPAFIKYPKLKKIKNYLLNIPKIKFARMTGSGSSIVAYFSMKKDSINALKIIKKKYKNYWCIAAKTI